MELANRSMKPAIELEALVGYHQKQMREEAFAYLQSRGIKEETVEKFRIGFQSGRIGFYISESALGDYFENRIIIPVSDQLGKVVDLIGRSIDYREPKYKALYGVDNVLFNAPALADSDDCVVCNGIFDTLVLDQQGFPAVCAPDLQAFTPAHAEQCKDKRIFICMGNDEIGRRESVRIEKMLEDYAKETFILALPENVRDINDLFLHANEPLNTFMSIVRQAMEQSMNSPIASDLRNATAFAEEYMKRYRGKVSGLGTGLTGLDEALLGGFSNSLYVLAGPVSGGKTMLMKQMADAIALQWPVVYATWEMSSFELWARSIARILGLAPRLVVGGKVDPSLINEANKQYAQIGRLLWTIECGMDIPLAQVANTIRKIAASAGAMPVVFIDHLQHVAMQGAPMEDASTRLTAAAYTMKLWSRELNCPVIAALPVMPSEAIPDGVEAYADVVMRLDGLTESSSPDNSGQIGLRIVKNRNGPHADIVLNWQKEKALFSDSDTHSNNQQDEPT
jgi:replicative DNA helicase